MLDAHSSSSRVSLFPASFPAILLPRLSLLIRSRRMTAVESAIRPSFRARLLPLIPCSRLRSASSEESSLLRVWEKRLQHLSLASPHALLSLIPFVSLSLPRQLLMHSLPLIGRRASLE